MTHSSSDVLASCGLVDALRLAEHVTPAPAQASVALKVLSGALATSLGMTLAELMAKVSEIDPDAIGRGDDDTKSRHGVSHG